MKVFGYPQVLSYVKQDNDVFKKTDVITGTKQEMEKGAPQKLTKINGVY